MEAQEIQIRRYGYQETPFGRRRRYQEIDAAAIRQAYNFPIQSAAADITHTALIRLPKVYRAKGLSANPVLTVYDSIIIDTPKNEVLETLSLTKQVMEYNSFPWVVVPIVADFKVGKTWGAMKSVNFS
jgi:DNA polymerase I-like protein with 3'-5' exonuclease and polymerase domains